MSDSFFSNIWEGVSDAAGNFTMDDFSVLAGHAIEYEKAKNRDPQRARQDAVQLATTPQITEPNNEIKPVTATQMKHQMITQEQARTQIGGMVVDKTILYGALGLLGLAVILKVAK